MGSSGLITILFTDLVGSTELASELGDAAADDLRREHFASLREAVAATGGTEVKTIGDALMVSYPGAADTIAGAATMQRAVERHNRKLGETRLAMRVGISAATRRSRTATGSVHRSSSRRASAPRRTAGRSS